MTSDTISIADQFPATIRLFDELTEGIHPVEVRYSTQAYPGGLNLFTKDWDPEETPLKRFFRRFLEKNTAMKEVRETYERLKEARNALNLLQKDVIQLVIGSKPSRPEDDPWLLLVDYFAEGKCKTRLGDHISLPADDANDRSLYTLLGVLRIVGEHHINHKFPDQLPWVASDESDERKQYKEYGRKASELGDKIGSAFGRAAAVAAVSVINPIASLPDEATIAMSYFAGITGRKVAEAKMHEYLVNTPKETNGNEVSEID